MLLDAVSSLGPALPKGLRRARGQSAGLGVPREPRLAGVEEGGLVGLEGPVSPPVCVPVCHLHRLVFQPVLWRARPALGPGNPAGLGRSVMPKGVQHGI